MLFFLAAALIVSTPVCHAQGVIDAFGVQVELVSRPRRIVTLAPSLGEMVAELLGKDLSRIVGVSDRTDFPAKLKQATSVGPYHRFNVESVLALRPDLVLATADGNPRDRVLRLRELGLPVLVTQQTNLSDIESTLLLVARSLGLIERGKQLAQEFRQGIGEIERKFKSEHSLRVLMQLGDDPLIVVGSDSFLGDCLRRLGVVNVYAGASQAYPRPAREDVVSKNPDVVVILSFDENLKRNEEIRSKWLAFKGLNAVKTGQVHLVQMDELLRPTPRILEGLQTLGKKIYGKSENLR